MKNKQISKKRNQIAKVGKVSQITLGNPNYVGVETERPIWQDFPVDR